MTTPFPAFDSYALPIVREALIEYYLDFRNNYLSPALFGEHNGLTETQAQKIIDLGRVLATTPHPEA